MDVPSISFIHHWMVAVMKTLTSDFRRNDSVDIVNFIFADNRFNKIDKVCLVGIRR